MAGSATAKAPLMASFVGTLIVTPMPIFEPLNFGLYQRSCVDVMPCALASEVIVVAFFTFTGVQAERTESGNAMKFAVNVSDPYPRGTRTQVSLSGGVAPRSRWGLWSRSESM